jgi:hypothetical protein
LNPHFRHGKAAGYRYIMGAELHHTKLSKISLFQEHRAGMEPASPRYDGRAPTRGVGRLPLDDQRCFRISGIGGHRTHIDRIKSPVHCLVCHNPVFSCRAYAKQTFCRFFLIAYSLLLNA